MIYLLPHSLLCLPEEHQTTKMGLIWKQTYWFLFSKPQPSFPGTISSAKENNSLGIKFSHTPYSRMYWNVKEEGQKLG